MIVLDDCFGNRIALSAERLAHILEHPEMLGMERQYVRHCPSLNWCDVLERIPTLACSIDFIGAQSLVANG